MRLARGHGNPRVHQALGSGAGPYLRPGPSGWPREKPWRRPTPPRRKRRRQEGSLGAKRQINN